LGGSWLPLRSLLFAYVCDGLIGSLGHTPHLVKKLLPFFFPVIEHFNRHDGCDALPVFSTTMELPLKPTDDNSFPNCLRASNAPIVFVCI